MKYQLVLQFQAESVQQFDELAVLEDLLVENLPSHSVVDGHDFGSGELNIFILTDQKGISQPLCDHCGVFPPQSRPSIKCLM
jgi:hypothetical protein